MAELVGNSYGIIVQLWFAAQNGHAECDFLGWRVVRRASSWKSSQEASQRTDAITLQSVPVACWVLQIVFGDCVIGTTLVGNEPAFTN